jgi:hypothetical protein
MIYASGFLSLKQTLHAGRGYTFDEYETVGIQDGALGSIFGIENTMTFHISCAAASS